MAGTPRPFWNTEMNSSWSMAIEIASRSLRARSLAPPTTGSSMLKPMYITVGATEVLSRMPLAISSLRLTSPCPPICTAWSKLSDDTPEAS
jgi:hypothetical protein